MVKKLPSAVKYRASFRSVQGFNHERRSSMDSGKNVDCSKKLSAVKYRASLVRAMVEGNSKKKQKPDKKRKMRNDSDSRQRGNGAMDVEDFRGEELTPCSINAVEKCEELVGEKRKRLDFMDSNCLSFGGATADETSGACSKRKVMLDQTEKATSLKLQKKELCGQSFIVRCPQIGKMSKVASRRMGVSKIFILERVL